MQTLKIIGVVLLGGACLLGPAVAQEQEKPGKKAKPARALRLTAGGAQRKAPTQDELKDLLAKKMAERFVDNASWITDFDEARAKSKETGRRIFVYFTRSYAP